MKRMVQTLQVNNPEAKIHAGALLDQTQLAERQRRKCEMLRQRILRMHEAEKRSFIRDYTKLL